MEMDISSLFAIFLLLVLGFSEGNQVKWTTQTETTRYWVFDSTGNFSVAQQSCAAYGGSLVVLSDNHTHEFVISWLVNQFNESESHPSFYLNAVRNDGRLPSYWADGSPFPGFALWGPFQPNDNVSNENCISLRHELDQHFIFDDRCDLNYSIICQRNISIPQWGEWEEWSSCSSSCEPGTRVRNRRCQQISLPGQIVCDSVEDATQMEPCNTNLCNETYVVTSSCNATCNESGFVEQKLTCRYNQVLPLECRNTTLVACSNNCTKTTNQPPTSSSNSSLGHGNVFLSQNGVETSDTPTTEHKQITSLQTTHDSSQQHVIINHDILIGICVGIAVIFLFLFFLILLLFVRQKKRSSAVNKRELPLAPQFPSLGRAMRASQHRPNVYSHNEFQTQNNTDQANNDLEANHQLEHHAAEDEDDFDGTYVTFTAPAIENEIRHETDTTSTTHELTIRSEGRPEGGDYIQLSEIERACTSRQDSNKSSSTSASGRTTRSDSRTLEFDYVTMPEPKRNDKYSQLDTKQAEPKQWSETYDIMLR